mgnify:CR=1 FL=1|tara:strand:- start:83 stop:712 length:630 start_codon:yes stop_codon:yes gene_type:complete
MSSSTQTNNLEIATISRDNPYVQLADDDDDDILPIVNTQTSAIYINGNTAVAIQVPTIFAEKAIKIQSMGRGIKCVCYVDLFSNLFFMMYGYILGFFFALAALSGIYSTYNQSRNMLSCYLTYQYIMSFSKLVTIIFYAAILDQNNYNNFHNAYPNIELPKNIPVAISMSTLFFVLQTYIALYVRKYYYLLPKNKTEKIIIAKALPIQV